MAKLNISQAARAARVSRKTMQTHIKQGKVSYETNEKGNKVIDTSELLRVYGKINEEGVTPTSQYNKERSSHHYTPEITHHFEEKIKLLEQQLKAMEQDQEERRGREGELLSIIKQQNTLLEDKRERKGFWSRLFGR